MYYMICCRFYCIILLLLLLCGSAYSLGLFFIGTVKVWDLRQKDTPVANMEPMEGETGRDCWTVAFGVCF